ncbi:Helix-turn-helix [Flavobacterium resistens]|uniref:Helix-turn-helix n=1 Tax=Flavobacterium resistens TaxID=443612 RepID=A0A521AFA0_9FLAO|nr:helix-turn-helix transcriptional regulator [Flavobacterium resistens]MRX69980.1 helix-turn-helix domain-containing protein [Flavobacterium resistens]SMO33477.1 Helix-turn-helix [Flavobacterium resistens]
MVNIDDFVKRLEIILDYYGVNASSFADKIGVQRSSMSHLLSGRNKPSLDFVMKIIEVFPDVDIYWLLNGKGNFPKTNEDSTLQFEVISEIEKTIPPTSSNENFNTIDLFSEINPEKEKVETQNTSSIKNTIFNPDEDEVEKIIFFYKNGKFKTYVP